MSEQRECVIRVEGLKKAYPNITPINNLSVEIYKGDVISVIGPSGTGKSTLLRCIDRLETPTEGKIVVLGADMTSKDTELDKIHQRMGMIFQNFNLFNHLNVMDNITTAPMVLKKMPREEAEEKARQLLTMVGLEDKAVSYPSELSGGQKQRVAIARALAMEPEILLLDEPTSALDPAMVQEVELVIERLAREGLTMMIVTHGMDFARRVSNRVFYMDEGIVYEDGTPEQIFEHPRKPKTKLFINRLKNLEIAVTPETMDIDDVFFRIDRYSRDNNMESRMRRRLSQVYDEIIVANVINRLEPGTKILFRLSADADAVGVEINYGGDEFDPFADMDEITALIVNSIATFSHSYEKDTNILTARVPLTEKGRTVKAV